jgi:hypothetical protein
MLSIQRAGCVFTVTLELDFSYVIGVRAVVTAVFLRAWNPTLALLVSTFVLAFCINDVIHNSPVARNLPISVGNSYRGSDGLKVISQEDLHDVGNDQDTTEQHGCDGCRCQGVTHGEQRHRGDQVAYENRGPSTQVIAASPVPSLHHGILSVPMLIQNYTSSSTSASEQEISPPDQFFDG